MKTQIAILSLLLSSLLIAPWRIMANDCTSQYGGATTCTSTSLIINKQVQNPSTSVFVENLGSSDAAFSVGQNVLFKIIITNNGTQALGTVTIKDVFPNELTFVGGPGTYDAGSNTLTFIESNVTAGETRTEQVLAKVSDKVNKSRSMTCIVNTSIVSAENVSSTQDTAQFCIQTNVLGATTLPVAGFNQYALLIPFSILGLVGMALVLKRS